MVTRTACKFIPIGIPEFDLLVQERLVATTQDYYWAVLGLSEGHVERSSGAKYQNLKNARCSIILYHFLADDAKKGAQEGRCTWSFICVAVK